MPKGNILKIVKKTQFAKYFLILKKSKQVCLYFTGQLKKILWKESVRA